MNIQRTFFSVEISFLVMNTGARRAGITRLSVDIAKTWRRIDRLARQ